MSIEALLTSLKESIDRNTAALEKAGGSATTTTAAANNEGGKKGGKAASKTEEPKVTQEQMNAALIKIKDDFGMEHAKTVIKEHGNCDRMAEIKPAQYQAVYGAAIAKHAELSGGDGGDDGGI